MIDARRAEVVGRIGAALGPEAQLHLVGGALRDLLLGRSGGDWDLATALDPREVMARAKAAHLRSLPTGLQHGTVTILVEGEPYEVTSFRGDGPYLDGRRPIEVRLGVSLEEHRDGVKIVEVSAGSLASHTGLRAGDIITEAAGATLKRSATLVALVRAQPPGTWLPLTLKRESETIERVVRFPLAR